MKAPNGREIIGSLESVSGVAGIVFEHDHTADFEYDGSGTNFDWDVQSVDTVAGAIILVDDDACHWMSHHLIPNDAQPVSKDTLTQLHKEEGVGRLLDALKKTEYIAKYIGISTVLTYCAVDDTTKLYDGLKAKSLSMIAGDLARVKSEA